jgi:DNA-damage-inducible protein J
MTKDATFSSRIDSNLKRKGDTILKSLGIKPSQALTMFYSQLVIHKGMPFQLKVPNEALIHSFEEAKDPENLHSYPDAKSAINDMWNNN